MRALTLVMVCTAALLLLKECRMEFDFGTVKNKKSFTGTRQDDRILLEKRKACQAEDQPAVVEHELSENLLKALREFSQKAGNRQDILGGCGQRTQQSGGG